MIPSVYTIQSRNITLWRSDKGFPIHVTTLSKDGRSEYLNCMYWSWCTLVASCIFQSLDPDLPRSKWLMQFFYAQYPLPMVLKDQPCRNVSCTQAQNPLIELIFTRWCYWWEMCLRFREVQVQNFATRRHDAATIKLISFFLPLTCFPLPITIKKKDKMKLEITGSGCARTYHQWVQTHQCPLKTMKHRPVTSGKCSNSRYRIMRNSQ